MVPSTEIFFVLANISKVTISGESAGGGSVMLQAMAYGGTEGTKYFQNVSHIRQRSSFELDSVLIAMQVIAASPYLPMQYNYNDWIPSQAYYAFAAEAGCFPGTAYGSSLTTIFDCLVGKDTATLQNASSTISGSGTFGTWAFLPVTDGTFVQQVPSTQLINGPLNGLRVLSGNNADEGPLFTQQNITDYADFLDFLQLEFPLFNTSDTDALLAAYQVSNSSVDSSQTLFATTGTGTPNALTESSFGTGVQEAADNIYAETTFVCPSYWMAQGFAVNGSAYKYQYSVVPAQHGSDPAAYFGPPTANQGPGLVTAFMQIWGNFIMNNDPSISNEVANGNSSSAANPASTWPAFTVANPLQINLNQTGGVEISASVIMDAPNVTEYVGPGLVNDISLVNAFTWEGGRGNRCNFWLDYAAAVPE